MEVTAELAELLATKSGDPLPSYAKLYFDLLWSDLLSALPIRKPRGEDRTAMISALVQNRASGLTWGDLHSLENVVLAYRSPDELRRIAWLIRLRYKNVAGPADYAAYIASKPPSLNVDSGTGEDALLALEADLRILLREILWIYAITPEREKSRSKIGLPMLKFTMSLVVLSIATYFVFVWFLPGHPVEMPLLPVVMAVGALGGFVSAQRRLFLVPKGGDRINQVILMNSSGLAFAIPPISGAVFAILTLLLFVSGLLQGDLFPKMATPTIQNVQEYRKTSGHAPNKNQLIGGGVNTIYVASMSEPADGKEYGKLLVWCFVAGFAETFVPGVITGLVAKTGGGKSLSVSET